MPVRYIDWNLTGLAKIAHRPPMCEPSNSDQKSAARELSVQAYRFSL
jgi:hypothetical protein